MDTSVKQKLEEERLIREKQYTEVIAANHEKYKSSHIRKDFNFTVTERRRIIQQESIQLMSNQAIEDVVNFSVLPRLGIEDPKRIILYDTLLGKFTVWVPKEEIATSSPIIPKSPETEEK